MLRSGWRRHRLALEHGEQLVDHKERLVRPAQNEEVVVDDDAGVHIFVVLQHLPEDIDDEP